MDFDALLSEEERLIRDLGRTRRLMGNADERRKWLASTSAPAQAAQAVHDALESGVVGTEIANQFRAIYESMTSPQGIAMMSRDMRLDQGDGTRGRHGHGVDRRDDNRNCNGQGKLAVELAGDAR
jgi:hypothetical protein